jgi:hypothetical protein
MPEWSLWLIPCVFAIVFGYTVVVGAVRAPQARAEARPCPSRHRDAVSVEDVEGELVAWLCVDPGCGEQLPKDWRLPLVDG